MTTKQKTQMKHARRRAFQRYGMVLSESELREIANMIGRGESEVLQRQSLRKSLHRVEWRGTEIVVAYDRKRKQVCTFLPDDPEWTGVEA